MEFSLEELQEIADNSKNFLECCYIGDPHGVDLLKEDPAEFAEPHSHTKLHQSIAKKADEQINKLIGG